MQNLFHTDRLAGFLPSGFSMLRRFAVAVALISVWVVGLDPATAQSGPEERPEVLAALERLYNFDFTGAHSKIDAYLEQNPDDAVAYAFRASIYLFYELDRLRVLESQFLRDDEKLADDKKIAPDETIRRRMTEALDRAEELALARLAVAPDDKAALFAMCLKEGVVTDYRALVEKRGIKSFSSARAANRYSLQLLDTDPAYFDAHLTGGINEYLIGSLPFFIRWFVRIDGVEGEKDLAFDRLAVVADRGLYLGPFARILLSIMHLREDRPEAAHELLEELVREYPENPLLVRELSDLSSELTLSAR